MSNPAESRHDLREVALKQFIKYFCENYPGPDTVIHKPEWHAPKIFRAAEDALSAAALAEHSTEPPRVGNEGKRVRDAHGWNIDQIMTFVWQMIAEDQTEHEYPFTTFNESNGGKRLRIELEALAKRDGKEK